MYICIYIRSFLLQIVHKCVYFAAMKRLNKNHHLVYQAREGNWYTLRYLWLYKNAVSFNYHITFSHYIYCWYCWKHLESSKTLHWIVTIKRRVLLTPTILASYQFSAEMQLRKSCSDYSSCSLTVLARNAERKRSVSFRKTLAIYDITLKLFIVFLLRRKAST